MDHENEIICEYIECQLGYIMMLILDGICQIGIANIGEICHFAQKYMSIFGTFTESNIRKNPKRRSMRQYFNASLWILSPQNAFGDAF